MRVPQRTSHYMPRSRQEWQLANRINLTRLVGRYSFGALWGGIALGLAAIGLVAFDAPLRPEALIGVLVAILVEVAGVGLSVINFFLHLIVSLLAVQTQRTHPRNPLPAKYLHAELVRWIKRIDLLLTTIATLVAILVTLGLATAVAVPSGIGLGFLGWAATEIWGFTANRVVYHEVRLQKESVRFLVESRSHPDKR